MGTKDGEAKVFGDGDITITFNQISACAKVYVGTQQIGFIQGLKLELNMDAQIPKFELKFPTSTEEKTQLSIEENIRVLKMLPWVSIIR